MPDVKLPDGTILRFPDGMSEDAMKAAVKSYLSQGQPIASAPAPATEGKAGAVVEDLAKSLGSGVVRGTGS